MIKNIQLYAERHTGSKWLTSMIKSNFGIDNVWKLGWKHWFPDYDKINKINQDEFLFIILSREPYEWIKAMCRTPHHADKTLKKLEMKDFLNKEWKCIWEKYDIPWISNEIEGKEMMHERNPYTKERFKNVLELREYKNKEFLSLKNKVKNTYYIKYEDLLTNPNLILNKISDKFNINKINELNNKPNTKTKTETSNFLINHINNNLNWEYEYKLGYKKL